MNINYIFIVFCFFIIAFTSTTKVHLILSGEFSGSFELNESELSTLKSQPDFKNLPLPIKKRETQRFVVKSHFSKLGYNGFVLVQKRNEGIVINGEKHCEKYLIVKYIEKSKDNNSKKSQILKEVLKTLTVKNKNPMINEKIQLSISQEYNMKAFQNHVYIRGPDNVTKYNPDKWNGHPSIQYHNNCYNYGNDVRTDTFAQPGRGTGEKWEENTCDNVWDAALRDGLIPYSRTNPPKWDEKPEKGHFIALVMWKGVNFHWYKKDISGYWSHKPGQTQARNYDNSGNRITDPAKCDRGPYHIFCGYLISVPSKMTIE